MRLSFHGAAGGVTGSCHLVECRGRRILVDCGMFQGSRELEEENAEPFGFSPKEIDALVLTHAHLDHCGRIPLLVRRGFRGPIFATAATRDLARIVMLDSAHLLEEEAARRARKRREVPDPLYRAEDVLDALDLLAPPVAYGEPVGLGRGVRATYIDAGHILGSAQVLLELDEGAGPCRLLFSGDRGTPGRPILRDPAPPPRVDTVVMESTYGNRRHRTIEESVEEFITAVAETVEKGGNVVVPTFALERAQELLYFLREAVEAGRLRRDLPVFLDSPMAISATEVFQRHPECYDEEARALFREGRDPFGVPGLVFTRQAVDSMRINDVEGGAVILAGSGMCTGGRVRHHLRRHLSNPRSAVIFVGYAARGTLARRIIDGAEEVRIFGESHPVRARIHTINGFSAHADADDLVAWHAKTLARRTILVHGEDPAVGALARRLSSARIERPELHESIDL